MAELAAQIRTEFHHLEVHEILGESPRVLLGVTPAVVAALAQLEVLTVFDLATSNAFESATLLLRAGDDPGSAIARHGAATADLVRESVTSGKKVDELRFEPISALEAVPADKADEIAAALDAQTVRDLALYPPYLVARDVLAAVFFPENAADFDAERPTDLLPSSGAYATERVQYTTLLMDAMQGPDGAALTDIASPGFTPLNLASLAAGDSGFKTVAFGALLTFNQSWFAQGVTLGQLLHSAALAPGESTRVAVIDWSRRSRAGETEVIDETDDLANDATHNRSISEVTKAVATEAQSGFSHASSNSTSTQEGTSSAGELSAPLGGLFGGPSGSIGHTSSSATTDTTADGYSSSFGRRDVASSMMQNVNDRTHQHAHSSRSRRASVIKEVSQTEHEDVSTRVLANYNHMHALTIQYYEVVQVFRVEVALAKAEKVIFIPVALADFADDTIVRRFKDVLARAALTFEIREALINLDVIEIAPDRSTHFAVLEGGITEFLRAAVTKTAFTPDVRLTAVASKVAATVAQAPMSIAAEIATGSASRVTSAAALPLIARVNDGLWSANQASRLSNLLSRAVLRRDSNSIHLPTDVIIESVVVAAGGASVSPVFHLLAGGTDTTVNASDPLPLSDVSAIGLTGSSPDHDVLATVTLTVNRNGVRFPIQLPTVSIAKGLATETPLVTVKPGGVSANLKQHLMANRLPYSQAVLRSLDAAQVALLLAGFGVKLGNDTVPVAQVIEPRPIRYVGNYLAFKMTVDPELDKSWAGWLKSHNIKLGSSTQELVPLGTGGTFAEAVLGRSNSAEKLDITRFWDWQDSPTPLQPTEIAAIQTGSRATSEDVKPGQLSNPIVNITSPTSLPDPVGTAAILAAIQNGSMFRDMSGLQGITGLAQSTGQATAAGAAAAGQQAGTNMENLLKANTERQRIAAEMITSLAKTAASAYTGGAVGAGGGISPGGGSSQQGAKINYFDKTQGGPGASGTGAAGGAAGSGAAAVGGGSSGGGQPGNAGSGAGSASGGGFSQNPAALTATWGDSQPPSALFEKVLAKVPDTVLDGGVPDGGAGNMAPFLPPPPPAVNPNLFDFAVKLRDGGSPGGWRQTSCLGFGFRRMGADIKIPLIVGTPTWTTRQGPISVPFAQTSAAEAAWMTASALLVALNNGATIPNIDQWFRQMMQTELRVFIDAATVSSCSGGVKSPAAVFDGTGERLVVVLDPPGINV